MKLLPKILISSKIYFYIIKRFVPIDLDFLLIRKSKDKLKEDTLGKQTSQTL